MTDRDYSLGPRIETNEHYALLHHVLRLNPRGIALEFGVGKGESTRLIAAHMPVIGFDSFEGLPEDWRSGFPAGSFAHHRPSISNCDLVIGLYADTLPDMGVQHLDQEIGLLHIDCDLYSSTATVFEHIGPCIGPGTCIVFDEWHGYPGAGLHEQRAWREFVENTEIAWEVIGHGFEQWAIRIV